MATVGNLWATKLLCHLDTFWVAAMPLSCFWRKLYHCDGLNRWVRRRQWRVLNWQWLVSEQTPLGNEWISKIPGPLLISLHTSKCINMCIKCKKRNANEMNQNWQLSSRVQKFSVWQIYFRDTSSIQIFIPTAGHVPRLKHWRLSYHVQLWCFYSHWRSWSWNAIRWPGGKQSDGVLYPVLKFLHYYSCQYLKMFVHVYVFVYCLLSSALYIEPDIQSIT